MAGCAWSPERHRPRPRAAPARGVHRRHPDRADGAPRAGLRARPGRGLGRVAAGAATGRARCAGVAAGRSGVVAALSQTAARVPVHDEHGGLALLVADPADPYPLQAVELAAGRPVALRVGLRSEIDGLIERYYGTGRSAMGTIVENLDGSAAEEDDVEHLRDLASEAPVIRLVNLILQRAVEQRASDVHIEPFENRLKVRYRIDGVLHEVE